MRLFRQILVSTSILLAFTFNLTSFCSASEQIIVVQGETFNLRSGPSMKCSVVQIVPDGTVLKVIGTQGVWYKVTTPPQFGSKNVWAATNKALTIIETDAVTQYNANLRSGPGFTFPLVAKLPKGTPLKVVGKYGIWYKVITTNPSLKAIPFWVTAKMGIVKLDKEPLAPAPSPAPAPKPTSTPPAPAPAPVAAPAPKPQPAASASTAAPRWLVRNTVGRFVILDDSSYWKVAPSDQATAVTWSAGDNINVMKSNDASFTVILFNTSRGNGAKVQLIAQ